MRPEVTVIKEGSIWKEQEEQRPREGVGRELDPCLFSMVSLYEVRVFSHHFMSPERKKSTVSPEMSLSSAESEMEFQGL
jgi:hypothetical protein